MNDLEFAIRSIPAQTLAGVGVKARIAAEYVLPADPKQPLLDDIVNSLIEDVLRIANVSTKRATTWQSEEGYGSNPRSVCYPELISGLRTKDAYGS
jgi:hypothetical protein